MPSGNPGADLISGKILHIHLASKVEEVVHNPVEPNRVCEKMVLVRFLGEKISQVTKVLPFYCFIFRTDEVHS
jgi:hypothetical protein